MMFVTAIPSPQDFIGPTYRLQFGQVSETADLVNHREAAPADAPDFQAIEQRLRDELNAAMERLNHAREQLSQASDARYPACEILHAASGARAEALRELERASIRFADFILNNIIPDDFRAPRWTFRSAPRRTR